MVEVKVGTILKDFKSGTSSKGPWAVAEVKAEQGYDRIKVWAANPNDIAGGMIVAEILSAKITNRKYEKDGQERWATDYNIQAKLAPIEEQQVEGFERIDEELPF